MKLFIGLLVLASAIAVSAVAGWFSIVGLAALFSAALIPVILMGCSLEVSKLVAAFWIHHNWKNPAVSFLHRIYLIIAVVALMGITSIGIYGFLMAAHLDQAAPAADVLVEITQYEGEIDQLTVQRDQLIQQQNQINSTVGSYLEKGSATGASSFMRQQRRDRTALSDQITAINTQITELNGKIAPLKRTTNAVEAKLGPVKHFAKVMGIDESNAVSIVIVILMLAFDPLAIVLMISGTITLSEWGQGRVRKAIAVLPIVPEPIRDIAPEEAPQASEELYRNMMTWVDNQAEVIPETETPEPISDHMWTDVVEYEEENEPQVLPDDTRQRIMDIIHRMESEHAIETAAQEEAVREYVRPFQGVEAPADDMEMPVVHSPKQKLRTIDRSDLFANASRSDILDMLEGHPEVLMEIVDAVKEEAPQEGGWLSEDDFKPKS